MLPAKVVEIYGRKITPSCARDTAAPVSQGRASGVWNEEALIASKEIISARRLIDALTFWVAGFRNVTASYA